MRTKILLILVVATGLSTACIPTRSARDSGVATSDQCEHPVDVTVVREHEMTWKWEILDEIRSGALTTQELITEFGGPTSIRPWSRAKDQQLLCRYEYSDGLAFWIVEDTVIGVEIISPKQQSISELPVTVMEAEKLYGNPDLVSWSTLGSGTRALVWFNKGTLANVALKQDVKHSLISALYFFEPMSESEFEHSVWAHSFLTNSRSNSDSIDAWPLNPFN